MSRMSLSVGAFLVAGLVAVAWTYTRGGMMTGGHDMTPPDTSEIAAGEPLEEVVIPASFSENAVMGERAFNSVCAACHGLNAAGQNGVAPPLVHRIYEPSHHGDGAFLSAVRNGVQSHHWNFGNMPAIEGLTGQNVQYIVAYVRELQVANGIN